MSTSRVKPTPAKAASLSSLLNSLPVRLVALCLLFTAASFYEAAHLSAFSKDEMWSHLRTGIWILQNHAVPHNGLFSQYPDSPWLAHDWGFDLLLAVAYKVGGLRALPFLLMILKTALAAELFFLARSWRQNFWFAVLLSATGQYTLGDLKLESAICSALLLAMELGLLLRYRASGNPRLLLWLPVLFAVWANLHSQFVYGVLVLLLAWLVVLVEKLSARIGWARLTNGASPARLGLLSAATAASLGVTLLTPYSYHDYGIALIQSTNPSLYPYLQELHAIGFREPREFLLLLMALAAFFTLGREHSRDLFKIGVLLSAAALSFYIRRDSWTLVIASVALIGDALPLSQPERVHPGDAPRRRIEAMVTVALVLVLVLIAGSRIPADRQSLLAAIGRNFPVRASDYIRNQLPGPLFNAYEWGGFLTWYLPEFPVAIDNRHELYGEDVNLRYFRLTHAQIPLDANFNFVYAHTILLPSESPMTIALSASPRFSVAYQDELATVLTRK